MVLFEGRVALVSGASRGLGMRVALALAREGADVAIAARTEQEHPRLPGTIHSVAEEVRALGRRALPIKMDATSDAEVEQAVAATMEALGRLDIVVHTAAAVLPTGIADTTLRRWDLMMNVNLRAPFVLMKAALPHLQAASGGHLLFVSPPLGAETLSGRNVPYALSKQAGTMLIVNAARELAELGIAANCLWPAHPRRTEGMLALGMQREEDLKNPAIFVDAAVAVLGKDPRQFTGRALTDEQMLALEGITDLSRYDAGGG